MTSPDERLKQLEADELATVLKLFSDEDLDPLVKALTEATVLHSTGIIRVKDHPAFAERFPEHGRYVEAIAEEICWFGTHDAHIMWHGTLSAYPAIVLDLCRRARIEDAGENEPAIQLEARLLAKGQEKGGASYIKSMLSWAPSIVSLALTQLERLAIPRAAAATGAAIPYVGAALFVVALGHTAWTQMGSGYRVLVPCIGHIAGVRQRLWRQAMRELGE